MTTINWHGAPGTAVTQTEVPNLTVLPLGYYYTPAEILAYVNAQVKPPKQAGAKKRRTPKLASHSNYCDCPVPLRNSPDKICDRCNKIIA